MKLSRKWLNEFVDVAQVGDRDFAEAMTLSGYKVEITEVLNESLKNVVVGKLLSLERHPRAQAEEKLARGPVLLDIEPAGAKQVRQSVPDAELIFIMPPSMEELERRLRGRGDTPEDQIKLRMERAVWEMEQRFWYDHVVVNDDPERCADEILSIIAE